MLKLKVGATAESDLRRLELARDAVGADVPIAVDANQRWGVDQAIERMHQLAPLDPYWIEEPTSPDDVLGHRRIRQAIEPIRVATGEHVQNRVIFKQLLQAEAIDVVQIDACRVGGVNENLAILLLAARFGVPVCPHAGGVGLCEMVQHLAMFDFVAVSGSTDGRWIEYVDHLHEHFAEPVTIKSGRYVAPTAPGAGAELLPDRSTSTGSPTVRRGRRDRTRRQPPSRLGPGDARPTVDQRCGDGADRPDVPHRRARRRGRGQRDRRERRRADRRLDGGDRRTARPGRAYAVRARRRRLRRPVRP